jgi:hypothetical protein
MGVFVNCGRLGGSGFACNHTCRSADPSRLLGGAAGPFVVVDVLSEEPFPIAPNEQLAEFAIAVRAFFDEDGHVASYGS